MRRTLKIMFRRSFHTIAKRINPINKSVFKHFHANLHKGVLVSTITCGVFFSTSGTVLASSAFPEKCQQITADIEKYWFETVDQGKWFFGGEEMDQEIRNRFEHVLAEASRGELDDMAVDMQGTLMLIIVLDQFSRNIHRGSARSYENDSKALGLTKSFLERGFVHDERVMRDKDRLLFALMPLMHSEDLSDQELFIEIATKEGLSEQTLNFARLHRNLIERFGRFPHRNAELGRENTDEEQHFLDNRKGMFE